jgi:hypothetical protein
MTPRKPGAYSVHSQSEPHLNSRQFNQSEFLREKIIGCTRCTCTVEHRVCPNRISLAQPKNKLNFYGRNFCPLCLLHHKTVHSVNICFRRGGVNPFDGQSASEKRSIFLTIILIA